MDDIGLGSTIANLIYLIILCLGVGGAWFFIKRKNIVGLIFWISFVLNLFSYLYFMGNYRFYSKGLYPIINNYWPWINLVLLIFLIIKFIKNKNAKTK
jgi:hypothetical protein